MQEGARHYLSNTDRQITAVTNMNHGCVVRDVVTILIRGDK